MTEHDFSALFDQYPTVIAQMSECFTSHEFILRLAQQHQTLYIEALYNYRNALHSGAPEPFMVVHGILAKHLRECDNLVEYIREIPSKDLFDHQSQSAEWRKR